VPQRLLGTIKDLSRSNRPFARASLAIAAWLQLLSRANAERTAAPFDDPLSLELRRRCAHSNVREIVEDTTALQAVFGDVGQDAEFRAGLVRQLTALREGGLPLALTELAQG
jgi:mannitol-1-phosphate/altronate dehydrogenase